MYGFIDNSIFAYHQACLHRYPHVCILQQQKFNIKIAITLKRRKKHSKFRNWMHNQVISGRLHRRQWKNDKIFKILYSRYGIQATKVFFSFETWIMASVLFAAFSLCSLLLLLLTSFRLVLFFVHILLIHVWYWQNDHVHFIVG